MDCTKINFCDKRAYNVTCDNAKRTIIEELNSRFSIHPLARRADVLSDNNRQRVSESSSFLFMQSTGTSYILFLTRFDDQEVVVFIDRKIYGNFKYPKIILAHIFFDKSLFDGTVLSGEMVKGFGEWMFLIDDVIAINGTKISSHMFRERYKSGINLLSHRYQPHEVDICRLYMKEVFQVNKIDKLLQTAQYMPYQIKGVCVKSAGPYRRDIFLRVQVTRSEGTSLLISSTPEDDKYEVKDPSNGLALGNACIPDMITSRDMRRLFAGVKYGKSLPVPCKWNDRFNQWQPIVIE